MPKGIYARTAANRPQPRNYPADIVASVRRMYLDEGMTVAEVQRALPKGYKAQRIIERYIPERRKAAKRDQRGPANSSWVGDDATYAAVHLRLKSLLGFATEHTCVDCGASASDWSYEGGCPDERVGANGCAYSTDPNRYSPRCKSCHTKRDRVRLPDGRFAPAGGDAYVC